MYYMLLSKGANPALLNKAGKTAMKLWEGVWAKSIAEPSAKQPKVSVLHMDLGT